MRFIFLFGGFVGFSLIAVTGLLSGRAGDAVLRDAAIGALAGALMFRWFWTVFMRSLGEAVRARREARRAVEEATAAAKAPSVSPSKAR